MYKSFRSFRFLAALSAALVLLSAASDWPLGTLANFWNSHSLLTNLYSEALFVIIGIFVIEHYMRQRSDRRHELVAAVASDAAGRGPLSQWRTMWFVVNGGRYISDLDFPIDSIKVSKVRERLRKNGLTEVDEAEVRTARIPLPDLAYRLTRLTADTEWTFLAYDILRDFTFRFRVVIARWSPLLASTTESGDVLLDLAAQAQEVTDLFIRLRPIVMDGRASLTPDELNELIKYWQMALCNAVALDEALAHFSGQRNFPWSAGSRLLLPKSERQLIDMMRDRKGSTMRVHTRTRQN
jgi:hypothetical protein